MTFPTTGRTAEFNELHVTFGDLTRRGSWSAALNQKNYDASLFLVSRPSVVSILCDAI